MSALADPRIATLQNQAGSSGELDLPVGDGCFRINLRDENIALWQETFDQHTTAANLLLACEESNGDLKDTRLTWVVGSAIRTATATASSPDAVGWLLTRSWGYQLNSRKQPSAVVLAWGTTWCGLFTWNATAG